jgi:putative sigma-54 modulation protein
MKVTFNSIHFDADQKLLVFINKKVNKLSTFDNSLISGQVYLKVEPTEQFLNKKVEIKLHSSIGELFASKQCNSFEEAVDLAIDALRKQILKHKEKKRVQ